MKALIFFIICLIVPEVTPMYYFDNEVVDVKKEEYDKMEKTCDYFNAESGAGFMKVHYSGGSMNYIKRYGYKLDIQHSRHQISKFVVTIDNATTRVKNNTHISTNQICVYDDDFRFYVTERL